MHLLAIFATVAVLATSTSQNCDTPPPPYAAGARQVIRSLVPAEVKKDPFDRENPHDAMCNTLDTMASISAKGYPNCWWEPLLWDCVAKWGGPLEALHAALSPTTALAQ